MSKPNTQFAHEMGSAIESFLQCVSSEMTMDEMHGKDVSWKELISRMDEREVEVAFKRLEESTLAYSDYYDNDMGSVPPGTESRL